MFKLNGIHSTSTSQQESYPASTTAGYHIRWTVCTHIKWQKKETWEVNRQWVTCVTCCYSNWTSGCHKFDPITYLQCKKYTKIWSSLTFTSLNFLIWINRIYEAFVKTFLVKCSARFTAHGYPHASYRNLKISPFKPSMKINKYFDFEADSWYKL